MKDLLDQYERVASISQAQLDFLMGVTEFYRARTDTKMTIAAERLAVIAAMTLPITATSSVVGMNVIVNEQTLGCRWRSCWPSWRQCRSSCCAGRSGRAGGDTEISTHISEGVA